MAMDAHPTPHATSTTRAGGSAWSRACTSGIDGRYWVLSRFKTHGRLKSPWDSIMSGPKSDHSTPPPLRNASITFGSAWVDATSVLASGEMENMLSRLIRASAWGGGSEYLRSS